MENTLVSNTETTALVVTGLLGPTGDITPSLQQLLVDATSAKNSATASAGTAGTAAGTATAAASTASTAAGTATSKAAEAVTSAGTASTAASTAATSAGTAATKAAEAAASAGTAATAATAATTAATTAGASATSATASAATATAKATEAAASAVQAGSSKDTVAGLLATFRRVLLGSFASDALAESFANTNLIPITDGIMYENTVVDKFRIYNGTAWQDYDSSAQVSQSAAALSAAAASTSAGNALASANSAQASVVTASAQASAATTQAGVSTTQAGVAAAQAVQATQSAQDAAVQAQQALSSATVSSTQATTAGAFANTTALQSGIATNKAGEASASATAAAASAGAAQVQVSIAAGFAGAASVSASAANTSAGNASGSAASALSIYGTAAAQQAALTNAQSAASLAQGYALSASSAVQQDLSGVTAQALHRSPNAVTALFVYDTSKDSDGGAWTEKCQSTSWYNEALMGKWLGAHRSEVDARYAGATLGSELLVNGSFDTDSSWTKSSGITIADGKAVYSSPAHGNNLQQTTAFTAGVTYRVTVVASSHTSGRLTLYANYTTGTTTTIAANVINSVGTHTYIFTPVSNGTGFSLQADAISSGACIMSIDSASVKQVTALTTASGDYYQSTTDGKFYRLWKNLLKQSNTFTDAYWGRTNVTPAVIATVIDGVSATQLTKLADGSAWLSGTTISLPSGTPFCISVVAKAGTSSVLTIHENQKYNSIGYFDLSAGTATKVTGSADAGVSIQPLGNGEYRCIAYGVSNGSITPFFYGGNTNVGAGWATGSTILIAKAQLEYGSTATTYEAKTADGSVTETFRGNKADFPRLAGIVADSSGNGTQTLTIYDLTEAGRPMWMRFKADGNNRNAFLIGYSTYSSIAGVNGVIAVANAFDNFWPGYGALNFPTDSMELRLTNSGGVSYRHSGIRTRNFLSAPTQVLTGIAHGAVNAVAMTVLPDAPTDAVTGLQVPTIAVATAGGLNVIRHNGVVATSSRPYGMYADGMQIVGDYLLCGEGNNFSNPNAIKLSAITGTTFTPTLLAPNAGPEVSSYTQKLIAVGKYSAITPGPNLLLPLRLFRPNYVAGSKGTSSRISNTFNTGHLVGDIRRAYLADTDVGSVSGTELVVNGTFDTNITGWSVLAGSPIITWDSGRLKLEQSVATVQNYVFQAVPVIPNRSYWVTISHTRTSGNENYWDIRQGATANPINQHNSLSFIGASGGQAFNTARLVIPTLPFLYIQLRIDVVGNIATYDDISVKEVAFDRSYKSAIAPITGTLTKSQVAAAAQTVSYSGFSAANYLREPYSADLDFGTGEWSCGAWVNVPIAPAMPSNNLLTNSRTVYGANYSFSENFFSSGTYAVATDTPNYTSDPDGQMTATRIQFTDTSGINGFSWGTSVNLVAGNTYTCSAWFKAAPGQTYTTTNGSGRFSCTVYAGAHYGPASSVTIIDSAWTEVRFTFTSTVTGTNRFRILQHDNTTGNVDVYVAKVMVAVNNANSSWIETTSTNSPPVVTLFSREYTSGASYNIRYLGDTSKFSATAFDGTTTRTVTTTAAYNTATWIKPEATYTTDGTLAIRVNGVEVAATRGTPLLSLSSRYNLLTKTEDFSDTAWNKANTTVSGTKYAAPNGEVTADLLLETTASGTHGVNRTIASIDAITTPHTSSLYVKGFGRTKGDILFSSETSPNPSIKGVFDLVANSLTITTGGTAVCTSSSITPLSNGWYKISITGYTGASGTHAFRSLIYDDSGNVSYTGDVAKGIYIWGAELRLSALSGLPYQRVNTATDFAFAAPLTIGNSFAADAPFPGSIALLKLSATVPTAEQSQWMYEQEKQMFRDGAQVTLPDAGNIVDLAYDDATDKWLAVSATNESEFSGLVRTSVTASPAGSYSKISAASGIQLQARTTTNPGVDVTIPSYGLREELVNRSLAAARLARNMVAFDYVGGFTANTTTGSTAIASAAGITYATSYIGARVSGTGIPADTFVAAVSGTTIYLTKAATATATAVQVSFNDFVLPVGYEAKTVLLAGVSQREGATQAFTRLFDGFKETIRFTTAPSNTAFVQIQATRNTQ